jgi:hypothetical protein
VGLSFTGCMGPNQIVDGLTELAAKLPATAQVWAGGSAPVLHRRTVPRVRALAGFDALSGELRRWRQDTAGGVSP